MGARGSATERRNFWPVVDIISYFGELAKSDEDLNDEEVCPCRLCRFDNLVVFSRVDRHGDGNQDEPVSDRLYSAPFTSELRLCLPLPTLVIPVVKRTSKAARIFDASLKTEHEFVLRNAWYLFIFLQNTVNM